ncbi:MAG: hypothetical protein M1816_006613 [Peltula sp. TS41687]|nr:MAG: hypothetical protein M1816_006613 [Peltula sp. TS41687]
MKFLASLLATLILSSCHSVLAAPVDEVASNAKNGDSFGQLEAKYRKYVKETLASRSPYAKCNSKNVLVRKEWGSMKKQDQLEYIKAVKCLYSQRPPRSSPQVVPGARNRFDDFQGAHIQQTFNVHFNGVFLAWHRHFVWLYERALRDECGYKGPTPYWDWTRHADDPRKGPVFDGSETSMGGNGESIPHGPIPQTAFGGNLQIPPGTGGGCVKEGPFTDHTVNLGINPIILPVGGDILTSAWTPPPNGTALLQASLAYNPRCLFRDISLRYSNLMTRKYVAYMLACPDALCLLQRVDGWESTNPPPSSPLDPPGGDNPGVHTAGHFIIGGLQIDPVASPGDPAFYLHHAQMDRVWTIWQAQDPAKRTYEISGPRNPFNSPPTDPVTPDDPLVYGALGDTIRLRDPASPIDGVYCYIYE